MSFFNQFSYPIFSLIILIVAILLMRRYKVKLPIMGMVMLFIAGGLLMVYLVLRPGISTINNPQEARDIIGNGRPTLVVFHSNFCSGCLAMNPSIVALADEIRADFDVIRVDIHTETGTMLTEELGFSASPEFVLYDANGREIWRSNGLPSKQGLQVALGDDS